MTGEGGIRARYVALLLMAAGIAGAHAKPAVKIPGKPVTPVKTSASGLAALVITNSVAVDGSALSLEAVKGGLDRVIVFPDGSVTRTQLRLFNSRLGTVSEGEGSGDVTGIFALSQKTLSILYADGRTEILNFAADHTVSILAKASTGEAVCMSWYAAGHRFSTAERKAALAQYAKRLGLTDARSKLPAVPETTPCLTQMPAPDFAAMAPRNLALASAPEGSDAWNAFDRFYAGFVAPHEGGYVDNDANGNPANFGINQGANPDIDVSSLDQPTAEQLLYQRYWLASGADQLPAALAMVQGDTAINMGVKAANDLLAQSGGDPDAYLELRSEKYQSIAAANPDKANYLSLWLARNDDLRSLIHGPDGGSDDPLSYADYTRPGWAPPPEIIGPDDRP